MCPIDEMVYNTQNVDKFSWKYACQNCGTPFKSKPSLCYDCTSEQIVPVSEVMAK